MSKPDGEWSAAELRLEQSRRAAERRLAEVRSAVEREAGRVPRNAALVVAGIVACAAGFALALRRRRGSKPNRRLRP